MSDIERIIASGGIFVLFQPIISVRRKMLIGFEALARGVDPSDGRIIPPDELFALGAQAGSLTDLDRECRRAAFAAFAPLLQRDSSLMLFLNLESSIIDTGVVGSGNLTQGALDAGVNPSNVVIEIVESKVEDIGAMRFFVESHRAEGFLIALDDVGAGHSNLNRIPVVRPDIIKVDRS
ncbi:MAG: EAL domain-containing protein, partial [Spirochaetota bacterium]